METEEQVKFLRAEGCDVLQGFRFSRAIRPAGVERMLSNGTIFADTTDD